MKVGDLVIWLTPGKQTVLAVVIEEEMGHGGGHTGWWRVLANVGNGPRKYLTRESNCDVLRSREKQC